jgi:hypothetical protein
MTGNAQRGSDSPRCEFELDATPFSPQLRNWNGHAKGRNNKFSKECLILQLMGVILSNVPCNENLWDLETWFSPPTKSPLSNVALLDTLRAL